MRHNKKLHFLNQHINNIEEVKELPADASFRYYSRVQHKDNKFVSPLIVMDCHPEQDGSLPSFIKVTNFLQKHNIKVPELYNVDLENGFLLMEDLGDISLTKHLIHFPHEEEKYYIQSADLLHRLHQVQPYEDIELYDIEAYLLESWLFIEWYIEKFNNIKLTASAKNQFEHILIDAINALKLPHNFVVLRDFHADNLMIHNEDIAVLDFQDALLGSQAYDLVSLLEDARRDVQKSTTKSVLTHFLRHMNAETQKSFLNDYAILGLQRNLKIMGFIARKMIRDNNDRYLQYFPRVNNYIKNNKQNEYAETMHRWLHDNHRNFY